MILSKRFPFFPPFRNFSKKILFRCLSISFENSVSLTLKLRYFIETTSRKRDYEFQMKVSTPSKCKNRGQSIAMSTHLQLKFITPIRTLSSSIGENSFSSFSWCSFPLAWTMSVIFHLRTVHLISSRFYSHDCSIDWKEIPNRKSYDILIDFD